jgi:hypothetical protein
MLYSRPKYALNHRVMNQVMSFSGGGARRTMGKDIPAAIDNEIACLEQAKALLSVSGAVSAKRKPFRLAKVVTAVCPKVQETRKRHKMSGGGAGAHPAGADQALGCMKRIQSEYERYRCATAKGEEEGRKGSLM